MRILMAVDGSVHSRRARPLLLRACGGRSHRVTVFNATPPVVKGVGGEMSITEAIKQSAQAMTELFARELAVDKKIKVGTAVAEAADPATASGHVEDRTGRGRARGRADDSRDPSCPAHGCPSLSTCRRTIRPPILLTIS